MNRGQIKRFVILRDNGKWITAMYQAKMTNDGLRILPIEIRGQETSEKELEYLQWTEAADTFSIIAKRLRMLFCVTGEVVELEY